MSQTHIAKPILPFLSSEYSDIGRPFHSQMEKRPIHWIHCGFGWELWSKSGILKLQNSFHDKKALKTHLIRKPLRHQRWNVATSLCGGASVDKGQWCAFLSTVFIFLRIGHSTVPVPKQSAQTFLESAAGWTIHELLYHRWDFCRPPCPPPLRPDNFGLWLSPWHGRVPCNIWETNLRLCLPWRWENGCEADLTM